MPPSHVHGGLALNLPIFLDALAAENAVYADHRAVGRDVGANAVVTRTAPRIFAPGPMNTLSSITGECASCGCLVPIVTWCITVTRLPRTAFRSMTMP